MRSPRPRQEISPTLLTAARPFFRYSRSRDAYILRGVGAKVGPVLRPRTGRFVRDEDVEPLAVSLFEMADFSERRRPTVD